MRKYNLILIFIITTIIIGCTSVQQIGNKPDVIIYDDNENYLFYYKNTNELLYYNKIQLKCNHLNDTTIINMVNKGAIQAYHFLSNLVSYNVWHEYIYEEPSTLNEKVKEISLDEEYIKKKIIIMIDETYLLKEENNLKTYKVRINYLPHAELAFEIQLIDNKHFRIRFTGTIL